MSDLRDVQDFDIPLDENGNPKRIVVSFFDWWKFEGCASREPYKIGDK